MRDTIRAEEKSILHYHHISDLISTCVCSEVLLAGARVVTVEYMVQILLDIPNQTVVQLPTSKNY